FFGVVIGGALLWAPIVAILFPAAWIACAYAASKMVDGLPVPWSAMPRRAVSAGALVFAAVPFLGLLPAFLLYLAGHTGWMLLIAMCIGMTCAGVASVFLPSLLARDLGVLKSVAIGARAVAAAPTAIIVHCAISYLVVLV